MDSHKYISSKNSILDFEIVSLKHKNTATWFSLIPGHGGALNEFVVNGKKVFLRASSELEFKTQTIQSFAGAQLFPYPNRVKNANYKYNGRQFELPKNDSPLPHSLHGLIYNKPFTVDTIDHEMGRIDISYSYQKNHLGFPFEADIKNTFQLEKDALTITTIIENKGDEVFPFGHGWHPYFKIDDTVDDWQLQIAADKYLPVNKDLIPNGTTKNNIDFFELNHCFKLRLTDTPIKAVLKSPKNNIELILELEGYNFLQTYIPRDRKSIALEPQTCAPDAFNNQIGVLYLKPKHRIEFKFKIKVIS